MKFEKHMKDYESGEFIYLSAVIDLLEVLNLHDDSLMESMPAFAASLKDTSNWFDLLKAAAAKMGLRLKKSETLWSYVKKGEQWFEEMLRLVSLYLLTDVQDGSTRKLIRKYAKGLVKQVDAKEIAAFILQLDRAAFGLTAHLRHILMSVFGIEVATYNKWLDDPEYVRKEFRHVKKLAKRRGISPAHIIAIDKLQTQLIQDIMNREVEKEIAKTKKLTEEHETEKISN